MIYDLEALGAMLDGDPVNATRNTAIFQHAIAAAAVNPGPIYIGMGKGMAVNNGVLDLNAPNMVVRGEAGMGTVSDWGPTSLIRGYGPGDTLKVSQGGCRVSGLCWQGSGQGPKDSFLKVTQTQVEVFDHFMDSPNIGISVAFPFNMPGQSWIRNVLMGGAIKYAGIDVNAGGAAVKLDHVRMFAGSMAATSPQPKYGVLVRSAGEFMMVGSCDIDNCGIPLAIVPGIDGVADTYVQNISISDCDFDNGNGDGQIVIRPEGSSFVLSANLVNVWCSSVNNGGGTWPGNGLTVDGSRSHTAMGIPSVMNVSVANSVFQNSVGHCGIYAKAVQGLGVVGCTAGGNYVGFQTYGCTGVISLCKAGAYVAPPLGQASGGNVTYGILFERSNMVFNQSDNALDGNGRGKFKII